MAYNFQKINRIFAFPLLFMGMIFILSCEKEKEISYDIPYDKDKLVLIGFISAQNGVDAYVSHTLSPSAQDQPAPVVNGVVVEVLEDGLLVDTLVDAGEGHYVSTPDIVFGESKKYALRVRAAGFDEVRTPQAVLPAAPEVTDAHIVEVTDSSDLIRLVYAFSDPIDSHPNFYQVNSFRYDTLGNRLDATGDEFFDAFGSFSDSGFDGQEYASYISTYATFYNYDTEEIIPVGGIELQVISFSEEVSRYLESTYNYEGTRYSPWYDPLPIYNNILGGYGIWGAYAVTKRRVSL